MAKTSLDNKLIEVHHDLAIALTEIATKQEALDDRICNLDAIIWRGSISQVNQLAILATRSEELARRVNDLEKRNQATILSRGTVLAAAITGGLGLLGSLVMLAITLAK